MPPPLDRAYYEKGSVELAVETPVMMKRLEKRRHLTGTAERLLIVLVGLPARGKSFIARKLLNYLTWRGNQCQIFNVGKYRRRVTEEMSTAAKCDADFFDDSNEAAARLRQRAAEIALQETLDWLEDTIDDNDSSSSSSDSLDEVFNRYNSGHESHSARRQFHKIAIFDATNSTNERRRWILEECAKASKQTGVLFLESICDDNELLAENFNVKINSCPDFENMTKDQALVDLMTRIQKYEARYETIEDHHQSYIKIFNLSSRLMVNHVYGRLAQVVLPAIMAWNTGSRPVFLCRAGETKAMEEYIRKQQQEEGQQQSGEDSNVEGPSQSNKRLRADRLGERGFRFRDALCDFIQKEGVEFMNRKNKNVIHPSKMDTGTSISGLNEKRDNSFECCKNNKSEEEDSVSNTTFPCLVMSSTMPRAVETATWKKPFQVKDVSNLNPLDMGDFSGMDLARIQELHPEWYEQLKQEPFHTRFPGGESYSDLIDRLYSIIIEMEQQLGLAVVVSHVSVLQVLVSYFRSTPIKECMNIEIPMHTVLKFVPLRGGGWLESHHSLLPDEEEPKEPHRQEPIWGDSCSCLPHVLHGRR